jgi:prophage regulatory protein
MEHSKEVKAAAARLRASIRSELEASLGEALLRINAPPAGVLPAEGLVRLKTLLPHVAFRKSTLWARVRAGTFPAPIKLGPRITAWRVEDVRAWITAQSAVGASK